MNRETALILAFGLVAGCSQHTTPLREVQQPVQVDDTASITPCKSLNDVCPEAQVNCEGESDSKCVDEKSQFFAGYCAAATSNQPCNDDGELTQDYKDFCEIEECLGRDKTQCLADGKTQCKPAFCNALDELQDPCGTWTERDRIDACDMSDAQAECIAANLIELNKYGGSNCYYPRAMKAVCAGGKPTVVAYAKCMINECLELTTAEACYSNYEALCSVLP